MGLPGDRLEGRPLSATAKSEVLILGVRTAAARGFVFVAAYDLNLLYFTSGHDRASMALRVPMHAR